jgi:hypothetical protein
MESDRTIPAKPGYHLHYEIHKPWYYMGEFHVFDKWFRTHDQAVKEIKKIKKEGEVRNLELLKVSKANKTKKRFEE